MRTLKCKALRQECVWHVGELTEAMSLSWKEHQRREEETWLEMYEELGSLTTLEWVAISFSSG